jgi:hypothetical protein
LISTYVERGEEWGECVDSRIFGGCYLENCDASFQECDIHFRLKRNIRLKNTPSHFPSLKRERVISLNIDEKQMQAFLQQ